MKKNIIIWTTAIILVIIAVYTTRSFDTKVSTPAANPPEQSQQTEQASNREESSSTESQSSSAQSKINLMADYDFTLEDLEGNKVTLSELKGKKVFLNFWATWCGPCKAEMPDIEKLYQETKDSDLVIIAVNVGETKKTVSSFIEESKYNFKVLLDTTGEVSQLYQVSGIPTSYFIDSEGFLDDGIVGSMPLESMTEFVNKLK